MTGVIYIYPYAPHWPTHPPVSIGNVVGVAVAKLDAMFMLENLGVLPENTNFGIKSTMVESFLQGNSVTYGKGSEAVLSGREMADHVSDNTLLLSCWMTMAQAEKMRSQRLMFKHLR